MHLYFEGKKLPFAAKMVSSSSRNTNTYKTCKLRRAIFSVFFSILVKNFVFLAQVKIYSIMQISHLCFTDEYFYRSLLPVSTSGASS